MKVVSGHHAAGRPLAHEDRRRVPLEFVRRHLRAALPVANRRAVGHEPVAADHDRPAGKSERRCRCPRTGSPQRPAASDGRAPPAARRQTGSAQTRRSRHPRSAPHPTRPHPARPAVPGRTRSAHPRVPRARMLPFTMMRESPAPSPFSSWNAKSTRVPGRMTSRSPLAMTTAPLDRHLPLPDDLPHRRTPDVRTPAQHGKPPKPPQELQPCPSRLRGPDAADLRRARSAPPTETSPPRHPFAMTVIDTGDGGVVTGGRMAEREGTARHPTSPHQGRSPLGAGAKRRCP